MSEFTIKKIVPKDSMWVSRMVFTDEAKAAYAAAQEE